MTSEEDLLKPHLRNKMGRRENAEIVFHLRISFSPLWKHHLPLHFRDLHVAPPCLQTLNCSWLTLNKLIFAIEIPDNIFVQQLYNLIMHLYSKSHKFSRVNYNCKKIRTKGGMHFQTSNIQSSLTAKGELTKEIHILKSFLKRFLANSNENCKTFFFISWNHTSDLRDLIPLFLFFTLTILHYALLWPLLLTYFLFPLLNSKPSYFNYLLKLNLLGLEQALFDQF